jgi:hypothetical protein
MGVQIDHNRSISLASTDRPIINADVPWGLIIYDDRFFLRYYRWHFCEFECLTVAVKPRWPLSFVERQLPTLVDLAGWCVEHGV